MRKKASLSINYIFLIFVSLIVVFVIIGLITKWSFNANKYMKGLFGPDDEEDVLDKQIINVSQCADLETEVLKHAKICYTRARQGEVKGRSWALCYGVPNPGDCGVSRTAISSQLSAMTPPIDNEVLGTGNLGNNVLIGYSYETKRVTVQ